MDEKKEEKQKEYLKIPLEEPLQYEGRILEELDLSGYHGLTLSDLNEIYAIYDANGGSGIIMQEGSLLFAQCTAAYVLKLPVEALGKLKARDAVKLKTRTYRFFYL